MMIDGFRPSVQNALKSIKRWGVFFCIPAACGEAERGEPWCGDRGVWLGLHSAHRYPGQHAEQWPCSSLWKTQRWGPDYVHQ